MILVIAEQRNGKLNRATWETIAAAQQLGAAGQLPLVILVPGGDGSAAAEVAAAQASEVVTVAHAGLEPYTPDGFTAVLQEVIGQLSPQYVLLPHTYQTRDFAPKLAARLDRALITDVTAIKTGSETAFVRPTTEGQIAETVAGSSCIGHFDRGACADSVRVLRARGTGTAAEERPAGPAERQSLPPTDRDRDDDVRRKDEARRAGR